MGIAQALRRLDDRVLPEPKPVPISPKTSRNSFLVGLIGTLVVLTGSIVTGRWTAIGVLGVFVGMMLGGGVSWYRSRYRDRE